MLLPVHRHDQAERGKHGVQAEAVALLRRLGFFVLVLQVRVGRGRRLLPEGTPDTLIGVGNGVLGWFEFKRAKGGTFSEAQLRFREGALVRGERWAAPQSAKQALEIAMHWRSSQ